MRPQFGFRCVFPCVVLCSLVIATLPRSALSVDCFDYRVHLPVLGMSDTPGTARAVAVRGEHAYVADGDGGLAIVAIADPSAPVLLGTLETGGNAGRIAVSGQLVVLCEGADGITVVDVTDPEAPFMLGGLDTPGHAMAAAFGPDNHICVADYDAGLQVIDMSDPTSPVLAGSLDTAGHAIDVAVAGHHAFVIDCYLEVIDVSNPSVPVLVATIPAWGECSVGVVINGDLAYVAEGEQPSGLVIFDIVNPATPIRLGSVNTPGVGGVAVAGDHAYLNAGPLVYVIDVLDPTHPQVVGAAPGPSAEGIAAAGDQLYVAARADGLRIIDTRSPDSPLVGYLRLWPTGGPGKVSALGSMAYVWDYTPYGYGSVRVIDVSIPSAPWRRGSLFFDFLADMVVTGTRGYVLQWSELVVIDVSNPDEPALLGSAPLPIGGHGVDIAGPHAFVAMEPGGLTSVDVSDPSLPSVVATLPLPGQSWDVAVDGSVAAVASRAAGVIIVDIADPAAMSILGAVDMPGDALGVRLSGSCAYVASGGAGVVVVDVSDPTSPIILGLADTPGWAVDLTLAFPFAYVADGGAGLQVVDVANPSAPGLLGGTYPGFGQTINHGTYSMGSAAQVAIADQVACVAAGLGGFRVLPLQCEVTTPVELSAFAATPVAQAILLTWSASFESDHLGFRVQRCTRGEGEFERLGSGLIEPPGPYRYLDPDVVAGTTYRYRLEAIHLSGGSEFFGPLEATAGWVGSSRPSLLQSQPNPFVAERGGTAIGFVLGEQGLAQLCLYDATGRLVRLLVDEPLSAGSHTAWWDGRSEQGAEAGSGIYYYRLDAGGYSESRSLVKLR